MSFKNILSMKKCSYVQQLSESNVLFTLFSQQIKENIAFQWIRRHQCLPQINVFVEPIVSQSDAIPHKRIISTKYFSENHGSTYKELVGETSYPFIIIKRSVCVRDSFKRNTFWNKSKFDCIAMALFCPNHQSLQWYQKLQSIQSQWFTNHSRSPLTSNYLSDLKENSNKWVLSFKSDADLIPLASIEHSTDSSDMQTLGLNNFHPIFSSIDLDNSLSALLCDAFIYENQNVMKLSRHLVPYVIAFNFEENLGRNSGLVDIAQYLIDSLKQFHIPVFPFSPKHNISIESCDEFGILFCVTISGQTFINGVLSLRNRDTKTEEMIHISQFERTILSYLELTDRINFNLNKDNSITINC